MAETFDPDTIQIDETESGSIRFIYPVVASTAYDECAAQHFDTVAQQWRQQHQPSDQELQQRVDDYETCLRESGYDPDRIEELIQAEDIDADAAHRACGRSSGAVNFG